MYCVCVLCVAKQKVIIIEFNEKQNSHKFHDRVKVVVVDLFLLEDEGHLSRFWRAGLNLSARVI